MLTWLEAYDFCCSIDMSLTVVQSRDKQESLSAYREFISLILQWPTELFGLKKGEFVNGEIWTGGKSGSIACKCLRWRSKFSTDALKRNLYWNKIYPEKEGCVYLELFNDTKARLDDPRLGLADCEQRKKFVCEVMVLRGYFICNV
jgi:hypothetical protein